MARRINSRQKGACGERELAEWLRENLGVEARRGVQFSGSADSPDVVTSLAGVHFECKRTESLSVYKAMDQAAADCGGNIPVVAHRRSRRDWLFIINAADLLKLCETVRDQCSKTPQSGSKLGAAI